MHSWHCTYDSATPILPTPRLKSLVNREFMIMLRQRDEQGKADDVRSGVGCAVDAGKATAFMHPQIILTQTTEAAPGIRITPGVPIAATGATQTDGPFGDYDLQRPLAVVPPLPGKGVSHLVVVGAVPKELLVLSLPGLTLIHSHILEGMKVKGLAADPWGGALVVCDAASQAVHVLAWPLPGMPPID